MLDSKKLLINAIIGIGFPSISKAVHYTEMGLAEFCGDQWNEDWKWKRSVLEDLDISQLEKIYTQMEG